MRNLEYFKGKVCSIFTQPINKNLDQKTIDFYFIGVVEDVDDNGVLITQIQTGLKSYFFFNSLIAIAEEEVIDPKSEEYVELTKKYEESRGEKAINPTEMMSLLEKMGSAK